MGKFFTLIASLCLALAGCGRDPHSAYVGVWQSLEGNPKTFEISKDGQAYFLQDLRNYNAQGKLNAPMVLSPDGDQLIVKTGFGQAGLALRENGTKLVFDRWTLSKVNPSDADQLKAKIASDFAKRAKDRNDCEALGRVFDQRENEINRSSDAPGVKLERQRALKAEKIAKASEIEDCKRQLLLY